MARGVQIVSELLRRYNLQNVRVIDGRGNPYENRVPENVQPGAPELYKSLLGTPVIIDLTFLPATYINNAGQTITTPEVVLETVLCAVNKPKNIVFTEIAGMDGTVKEYIGFKDFEVTINGILTAPNGVSVLDQLQAIDEVYNANTPIQVVNAYLQALGIYSLVFTDFPSEQEAGGISKQAFTLQAVSDKPVELFINNALV